MSQVMRLCHEAAFVECSNCGWKGRGKDLDLMSDFEDRVMAGEPAPAGQCPECAALAHLRPPPFVKRMVVLLTGETQEQVEHMAVQLTQFAIDIANSEASDYAHAVVEGEE